MTDTECGWPIAPGRRVRLRVSVWDDRPHHRGFLGKAGDVLFVLGYPKTGPRNQLIVSPTTYPQHGFVVKDGEVELYWEQPSLFPATGGIVPPDFRVNIYHR